MNPHPIQAAPPPQRRHRRALWRRVLIWVPVFLGSAWAIAMTWYAFGDAWWRLPVIVIGLLSLTLSALRLRSASGTAGVLAAVVIVDVALWLGVRPRDDRDWEPDVARTPWAEIEGDIVTLHNYRNFAWRSEQEADARWETRRFRLSQLTQMEFVMTYWGSPLICHTMVSFDFGPDGRICASVEARRENAESYSPLAGIFRRYELIYVFGDECDLLRLRTNIRRGNDVYILPLMASPEQSRREFLDYLRLANELREKPAWYNTLVRNCTTAVREHAQPLMLHEKWNWRLLFNGRMDEYLYERGFVSTKLKLPDLKRLCRVSETARQAGDATFSLAVRATRP